MKSVLRKPKTGGDCFIRAANYVLDNPDARYCEAVVINTADNKPMRHAFVDLGNGKILDQKVLEKNVYYVIGRVSHVYKMNRDRLAYSAISTGHYGAFFDLPCSR
jgi:hypothetical protein